MTDILLLIFIFMLAGVIAVPLASRFGLGTVLGYLLAGILISPILLVLHVDVASIQHFAEFGVVMMLFIVGLELEPRALWNMRVRLVGLGGGQVVATAFAIAGGMSILGFGPTVSIATGLTLALSSTAIVLQTLTEKGLARSDGGKASFSVLLMQDIAVIPMLAFIPLLSLSELVEAQHAASPDADHHGDNLSLVAGLENWEVALVTLGAVGFVVVGGVYLVNPLFRFISRGGARELFTAAALLIVVAIALLMSLVGISPALGTFLAGVVLANSSYRHELESDLEPFKSLLLGLFFITVGAAINFELLFEIPFVILGATVALIAVKSLVLYAMGVLFRVKGTDRWLFVLGMAQAGEFGFVLLGFNVSSGVMPPDLADKLLLVVALSMLLTPGLFIVHDRILAPRLSDPDKPDREADEMPSNKIIIAGAGRVGEMVDQIMMSAGYETTVIENNSQRIETAKRFGVRHYFGDPRRPELLIAAGIAQADLLIVATPDRETTNQITTYVLENHPHVHVIARAVDRNHVYDLWAIGCRDIIRETHDSTLRMGRSALQALGISEQTARAMVNHYNEVDRDAMLQEASSHKRGVAPHENPEYIARVKKVRAELFPKLGEAMTAIRHSFGTAEAKPDTPEDTPKPAKPDEDG